MTFRLPFQIFRNVIFPKSVSPQRISNKIKICHRCILSPANKIVEIKSGTCKQCSSDALQNSLLPLIDAYLFKHVSNPNQLIISNLFKNNMNGCYKIVLGKLSSAKQTTHKKSFSTFCNIKTGIKTRVRYQTYPKVNYMHRLKNKAQFFTRMFSNNNCGKKKKIKLKHGKTLPKKPFKRVDPYLEHILQPRNQVPPVIDVIIPAPPKFRPIDPEWERNCYAKYSSVEINGRQEQTDKCDNSQCSSVKLPGCKERGRSTCDTIYEKPCQKIKPPYKSFADCCPQFPEVELKECDVVENMKQIELDLLWESLGMKGYGGKSNPPSVRLAKQEQMRKVNLKVAICGGAKKPDCEKSGKKMFCVCPPPVTKTKKPKITDCSSESSKTEDCTGNKENKFCILSPPEILKSKPEFKDCTIPPPEVDKCLSVSECHFSQKGFCVLPLSENKPEFNDCSSSTTNFKDCRKACVTKFEKLSVSTSSCDQKSSCVLPLSENKPEFNDCTSSTSDLKDCRKANVSKFEKLSVSTSSCDQKDSCVLPLSENKPEFNDCTSSASDLKNCRKANVSKFDKLSVSTSSCDQKDSCVLPLSEKKPEFNDCTSSTSDLKDFRNANVSKFEKLSVSTSSCILPCKISKPDMKFTSRCKLPTPRYKSGCKLPEAKHKPSGCTLKPKVTDCSSNKCTSKQKLPKCKISTKEPKKIKCAPPKTTKPSFVPEPDPIMSSIKHRVLPPSNSIKKKKTLTLWQRILAYFSARPNCPDPNDYKKKELIKKATQMGLKLCDDPCNKKKKDPCKKKKEDPCKKKVDPPKKKKEDPCKKKVDPCKKKKEDPCKKKVDPCKKKEDPCKKKPKSCCSLHRQSIVCPPKNATSQHLKSYSTKPKTPLIHDHVNPLLFGEQTITEQTAPYSKNSNLNDRIYSASKHNNYVGKMFQLKLGKIGIRNALIAQKDGAPFTTCYICKFVPNNKVHRNRTDGYMKNLKFKKKHEPERKIH